MTGPYLIGVWQASLIDATTFISKHMLARDLVQFVEDKQMRHSYWVMLRVTGDQMRAIKESINPKHTVIP